MALKIMTETKIDCKIKTMDEQVNDLQQLLNYYKGPEKIFLDIGKEQMSMNTFIVRELRIVAILGAWLLKEQDN
jgi:hypothetical protein